MLNFLKEKTFVIIISIIWGLGLSCVFRQSCVGRDCISVKAPPPNTIIGKVFKDAEGKKCYKYLLSGSNCNSNPVQT